MSKVTEKSEIKRLMEVYGNLEPKKLVVAQGLIVEAARLRVRLDYLWADIQENGQVEMFTQSDSTDPYERERPASRQYTATNKSYQAIIKQLNEMIPVCDDEIGGFDCD